MPFLANGTADFRQWRGMVSQPQFNPRFDGDATVPGLPVRQCLQGWSGTSGGYFVRLGGYGCRPGNGIQIGTGMFARAGRVWGWPRAEHGDIGFLNAYVDSRYDAMFLRCVGSQTRQGSRA